MKNKLNAFLAFLFGTVIFWSIAFVSYKIWPNAPKVINISPPSDNSHELHSEYLENVKEFGPLKIGSKAPNGFGETAPFEGKPIPKSSFYVYVHQRGLSLCEYDSCGFVEGRLIACMGGWLSGDGHTEISDIVGLNSLEVSQGKASIVVVSDQNSQIIGIYPNHTQGDILPILNQFPEYKNSLIKCYNAEIGPLLEL